MNRSLIVMRHAKSAWPVGVPDLQRSLSKRGRRDAKAAGRLVAAQLPHPDLIIVSPARRTEETLKLVEHDLADVPTRVDERVYGATWWELTDVIHETPSDVMTLMLVGHNPGLEDLVGQLAGAGDPAALHSLRLKFPTCAIALLSDRSDQVRAGGPSEDWTTWNAGTAHLDRIVVPRG